MARMRTIKPSFFTNDVLAEVPPLGRLLFSGLWCIADREGRLEDRPKRIKAELLPYDSCDVSHLLNELAKRGFILRYESGGTRYIQVVNFTRHQTPHIKELPSGIPAPDEHGASTVQAPDKPDLACARSGFLVPGNGVLGVGSGEREPQARAREETADFSPESPELAPEALDTQAAEIGTDAETLRTAILPQWADRRLGRTRPANGWLADLRTFGRAFVERAPASANGRASPPVTFEQQKQINNARAAEEFLAVVEGRTPNGSQALSRADKPPRRGLPRGDTGDDDGGVLDGLFRER